MDALRELPLSRDDLGHAVRSGVFDPFALDAWPWGLRVAAAFGSKRHPNSDPHPRHPDAVADLECITEYHADANCDRNAKPDSNSYYRWISWGESHARSGASP